MHDDYEGRRVPCTHCDGHGLGQRVALTKLGRSAKPQFHRCDPCSGRGWLPEEEDTVGWRVIDPAEE